MKVKAARDSLAEEEEKTYGSTKASSAGSSSRASTHASTHASTIAASENHKEYKPSYQRYRDNVDYKNHPPAIKINGKNILEMRGPFTGLYSWLYNCLAEDGSWCGSSQGDSDDDSDALFRSPDEARCDQDGPEMTGWTENTSFKSQISNYLSRQMGRRVYYVKDQTLGEVRTLESYHEQEKKYTSVDLTRVQYDDNGKEIVWEKNVETPQRIEIQDVLKPLLACTNLNEEEREKLLELYSGREDLLLTRLERLREDQKSSWKKGAWKRMIRMPTLVDSARDGGICRREGIVCCGDDNASLAGTDAASFVESIAPSEAKVGEDESGGDFTIPLSDEPIATHTYSAARPTFKQFSNALKSTTHPELMKGGRKSGRSSRSVA